MVLLDHLVAEQSRKKEKMELKNNELVNIIGGSITGSLMAGFSKVANSILEIGRNLGSALRRMFKKKYC